MELILIPGVEHTVEAVKASNVFSQWFKRLPKEMIPSVLEITTVHGWDDEIKMIVGIADGYLVFLRGDTVDISAILTCEGKKYALFVVQPRIAGAQSRVVSNPSGMVDTNEQVVIAALRELNEEVELGLSFTISWSAPILLKEPSLVSPGGTDERVFFYGVTAELTFSQLQGLQGHVAGLQEEDERTELLIVPLEEALDHTNDVKAQTGTLLHMKHLTR
jgi:8-oxo-dGTP pyrophosphatase MutT (NUDIX family)